nr:hypothetical protein [Tanacetum cinerariifolium]
MEDDVDINTLTMEQYLAWVHDDIKPGVVKPKVDNDVEFEINRNFMRELKCKVFKGTDDEDAHKHVRRHDLKSRQKVHIFYTGLDIPTRLMLDSKGFIPLMTPAQALKTIQNMAEHSHNWYDKATTKESINDSSDKVDTKKLKENIQAIQDITVKDVEGLRQILTPTIHTLPNLETAVQPYRPLGPVHDKAKVTREEEQDYDIPLHDGVMRPLTSETIHITPPDDDYVASATNLILDKYLNECGKELFDMKGVNENGKFIELSNGLALIVDALSIPHRLGIGIRGLFDSGYEIAQDIGIKSSSLAIIT